MSIRRVWAENGLALVSMHFFSFRSRPDSCRVACFVLSTPGKAKSHIRGGLDLVKAPKTAIIGFGNTMHRKLHFLALLVVIGALKFWEQDGSGYRESEKPCNK